MAKSATVIDQPPMFHHTNARISRVPSGSRSTRVRMRSSSGTSHASQSSPLPNEVMSAARVQNVPQTGMPSNEARPMPLIVTAAPATNVNTTSVKMISRTAKRRSAARPSAKARTLQSPVITKLPSHSTPAAMCSVFTSVMPTGSNP